MEVTLQHLRGETVQASKDLSSVFGQIKEAELVLSQILGKVEDANLKLHETKQQFQLEKDNVAAAHSVLDKRTATFETSIKALKTSEKDAQKMLSMLNNWILAAEDRKKLLAEEEAALAVKLEHKRRMLDNLLDLENQINGLEEQRDLLRMDNSEVISKMDITIHELNVQLTEVQTEVAKLNAEAHASEDRKRAFDNEYLKKKYDLEIFIKRVEKYYNQAFPELIMIL